MPRLTVGDMHVNRPLTDMAIAAFQKDANFIAREAPFIRSLTRSNQYFIFDRGDFNRIEVEQRAPASRAKRGGYSLSTETFTAVRYSLAHEIPDEIENNYDVPLDPEGDGIRYLSQNMNMFREDNLASIIFAASWGTNLTGTTGTPAAGTFKQWDQTGSTPIEDIRRQKTVVQKATSYMPNEIWMGQEVWDVLVDHPSVIDRMKANGSGQGARSAVSKQAMAELLGVDVIRVSGAIKNTANEGQTASHSFMFGKSLLLCYLNREPTPRVKEPSAFYTFAWTGFYGAEEQGFRIKRYREEPLSANTVEVDSAFVTALTGTSFAVYFASCVA